eukprot:264777-Lingulodinium_polyedra.AAC.1
MPSNRDSSTTCAACGQGPGPPCACGTRGAPSAASRTFPRSAARAAGRIRTCPSRSCHTPSATQFSMATWA